MRVLNFGSLNVDYVYNVDRFVSPGETKLAKSMNTFCGGKGLNQSIALARAGVEVYHAGLIGQDGRILIDRLNQNGVITTLIEKIDKRSGHAIIQVDETGQNNILLYGGTNRMVTQSYVDQVLSAFDKGDLILLQNEINLIGYIIEKAKEKGMRVAFNAAPMDESVREYPLNQIDWLFINEVEGGVLSRRFDFNDIVDTLIKGYPSCRIVLTLGKSGVKYKSASEEMDQTAYLVNAVDTTAAGDTFIGYFLRGIINELTLADVLDDATKASALCVMKKGASDSIPSLKEVMDFSNVVDYKKSSDIRKRK